MKLPKFKIALPPDAADLYPDLVRHGRGKDPRGDDLVAWEREEAARLERVEARRRAAETAPSAKKPEAAE